MWNLSLTDHMLWFVSDAILSVMWLIHRSPRRGGHSMSFLTKTPSRTCLINDIHDGVVDYVLTTPALFNSIDPFEIGVNLPESDHEPILFRIKYNIANTNILRDNKENKEVPSS